MTTVRPSAWVLIGTTWFTLLRKYPGFVNSLMVLTDTGNCVPGTTAQLTVTLPGLPFTFLMKKPNTSS
jgi:hypothetical protein